MPPTKLNYRALGMFMALAALGACGDDGKGESIDAADSESLDASAQDADLDAGELADAAVADAANIDASTVDADLRTGSAFFTWSVNGTTPALQCPGGSTVTIESTTRPAAPISQNTSCQSGLLLLPALPVGDYVFDATLTHGSESELVSDIAVTVAENQQSQVANIDFQLAPTTGAASLSWTIEGGLKGCPVGAMVTATVEVGATNPGPSATDCTNQPLVLPNLAPGQYQFKLVLDDPIGVESVEVTSASTDVSAGMTSELSLDFASCPFCPSN